MAKVTVSVIKADIGGFVGHSSIHPNFIEKAKSHLQAAKNTRLILDFHVTHCGDDLELIMTHRRGADNAQIHSLSWDVFRDCTELAKEMKLYGAGQDILVDTFSGNVKGMGPGVAEMEFEERRSEPVIIFMGDKTSPGAWNFPLFKIFADPFNTVGLAIDPSMHEGFSFEIIDVMEGWKSWVLSCPEEMYELLALIGAPGRYLIRAIYRRKNNEIAAIASTQKLSLMAGRYIGKDDPVLIVRAQSGFPAVGEILEAFTLSHLVEGWMRGSHHGPLMPVSFKDANPTRFDGPPRVIAAGFQISNGKLLGPRDMFDDPSFDEVRRRTNEIADYLRRHGPFEPHRLPLESMEYTTLSKVLPQIETKAAIPRATDLEKKMKSKYDFLRDVVVVDLTNKDADLDTVLKLVGKIAAMYFETNVARNDIKVGISCGRFLLSTIDHLTPGRFSNLHIYPLQVLPAIPTLPDHTALSLIGRMAAAYPGSKAYPLPLAPFVSRKNYEKELLTDKRDKQTYQSARNVNVFLFGIGSLRDDGSPGITRYLRDVFRIDSKQLQVIGAKCEMNYTLLDDKAEPITESGNSRLDTFINTVVTVVKQKELRDMAQAKDKWVIAIAGGKEKLEAVKVILKGRYFNVLITDSLVASSLIKK